MSQDLLAPLLWLIPAAPLLSAITTALLGPKLLKYRSHIPCWSALAVSFAASLALLIMLPQQTATTVGGFIPPADLVAAPGATNADTAAVAAEPQTAAPAVPLPVNRPEVVVYIGEWMSLEPAPDKADVDITADIPSKNRQRRGLQVPLELRVDSISSIMLAMVTGVSLLVALFGSGYMHHDAGYPRFFAAVSMFVFSMCMLVMSNSFVMLFVFWEMVGLCSYLLIGFWFRKPSAAAASKKAFVLNRIGDFGLIMGIFLIWTNFGTVEFAGVLSNTQRLQELAAENSSVITLICFCLFLGAMGKSAQFPLHVWLPDAMEGPTPVSALIHAATSGNPKFFLGTDSAPHARDTKEAACGCAGVYTAHAGIELYAEIFGAYNALDKLVGHLARTAVPAREGWLLMTSRASYELVQKAACAGIELLAAVSAPTGLAVRLAERSGIGTA